MNQAAKYLTLLGAVFFGLYARAALPQHQSSPADLSRAPVLLITVDTLRADHLSCYGAHSVRTPAMDALAAQGVRFENALAQVPITLPSHAAILTGTYPMYNGVRDFTSPGLPASVGLLAEAFQRHGYETAAFVSAFVLDSSWGFGRGFETYDDQFDPKQFETRNPGAIERRAGETVGRALAWFKSHQTGAATARPFFVWLHLYDPHSPYDPPEPFHTQFAGHLYGGEIAYADSQLARLFDYLRKSGIYDRALIVLLSDHGESLGEHGEDEHGFFVYNATLHVPLIFKLPRGMGSPRVVRQPVGTIDLAPTLLDLAHLSDPLSRQFQGVSLAAEIVGKGASSGGTVYSETYYPRDSFGWSELRSISTDRFKYIEAPHPELYDLLNDPRETHNLYGERASLAAALREQLAGIERRYDSAGTQKTATGPPLPTDTVEKLKSLGYLAYSAPVQPASAGPLPDPKDRLKIFKAILRAQDLTSTGRVEESNRLLGTIEPDEPHLYLIPFMEAENYARERRWSEAQQSFLACLKLNPTFEQAILGLAHAYMAQGNAGQAKPWLELAIHRDPRNFLAYYGLGLTARWQGNQEEAQGYFQKAVNEKPEYPFSQQELGVTLVDLRRYEEALGPLTRAERLGLENARLENYFGTALVNVGRSKEAVEHYQRALKLKPDYDAARLNLSLAYLKLGDRRNAQREFASVCRESPSLCQQYRSMFE